MIDDVFNARRRPKVSCSQMTALGVFGWLDGVLLVLGVRIICHWQILGRDGDYRQAKPALERNQFPDIVPLDPVADPLQQIAAAESRQGIRPREERQRHQSRQGQGDAHQVQGEVDRMLMPQPPLARRRAAPADDTPRNREVVSHGDFPSGQQVHRCTSKFVVIGMETPRPVSAEPAVRQAADGHTAGQVSLRIGRWAGGGMSGDQTKLGVKIAPSILSADFARLGDQVREVEAAGADRIHVDVMDGHFVPNLSMGAVVVRSLRPVTRLPLEVHLMVEEPGRFLDGFVAAGADTLIVHLEVLPDPRSMLEHIRRGLGKRCGLAINPDMPVERLRPYLRDIDVALCMTVFPGFGGQSYIPESTRRIAELRRWIAAEEAECELEVDGGIDAQTIVEAARAGANVFVAGTAIFSDPQGPAAAVQRLAEYARQAMTPRK